jgi:hypothetical protein
VLVTQAVEKEGRRTLMCFDRRDGRLAWQQGTVWNEPDPTHGTNPQCSASPVCRSPSVRGREARVQPNQGSGTLRVP